METQYQPFDLAAAQTGGNFNRADHWNSGEMGGPSISTENGMFSMYKDGQRVGVPVPSIDVVLVGQFPEGRKTYRTFWASTYNPRAAATQPDCWSPDGRTPHPSALHPQSANCEGCPKNAKGSGLLGGDSRACAYRKNLAVSVPSMNGEVFTIRASAKAIFAEYNTQYNFGGLFAFDAHIGKLVPQEVVARLSFPMGGNEGFRMSPIGVLQPAQASWMIEAGKRPDVLTNLTRVAGVVVTGEEVAPQAQLAAPAQQPGIVYQAPVQQAPVQQAPAQPVYQAPVQQAPAQPVYQAPVQPVYQAPVQQAPAQPVQQAPVQPAVIPPVPYQPALPISAVPSPTPQAPVLPAGSVGANAQTRLQQAFSMGPGSISTEFN